MIVADAGFVIALRDPEHAHSAAAVRLNKRSIDESILLHPMTLAECLVGPAKLGVREESVAALRAS